MKDEKYLELLAEKYPTEQAVCREIINLKAILGLPKGTEHFMSDLHGEYEAFCHILNNCSGVIREKVDLLFEETLSDIDREEICTLIYYPVEKLEMMKKESRNNEGMIPCDPRRADRGCPAFSPPNIRVPKCVKRCRMSTLIFWMN